MIAIDGEEKILKFTKSAYGRLIDTFSPDEIKELDEEYIRVSTYRKNDSWLLAMILSFGDQVEVLAPESLIADVKDMIIKMNNLYK